MNTKQRFFSLLAGLLTAALLLPAQAQTPSGLQLGTFVAPSSSTVYTLPDGPNPDTAPDGMEPLYLALTNAAENTPVYLVQAQNGYAFTSVAIAPCATGVETLLAAETAITESVLDGSNGSLTVQAHTLFSLPCVQLTGHVFIADIPYAVQGVMLPMEENLLEIWTAWLAPEYPAPNTPTLTQAQQALLEADRDAMLGVIDTLSFTSDATLPAYTAVKPKTESPLLPFADAAEHYRFLLPEGTREFGQFTPSNERQQALRQYYAQNGDGVRPLMNELVPAVSRDGDTLYFLPDGISLLDVAVIHIDGDSAASDELSALAEGVETYLQGIFDAAFLVTQQSFAADGLDFCMSSFFVRCGQTDYVLDVLLAMEGDTAYEMDLYTPVGNNTTRTELLWLMQNRFTFPATYHGTPRERSTPVEPGE